jgi:hypothetical protein
LQKAQQNDLFNDDGDECNAPIVGVLATTAADNNIEEVMVTHISTPKDLFLYIYGLQKLGFTTIAKWMHAVGFRYKKRENMTLLTVTKDRKRLRTNLCLQESTWIMKYEGTDGSK